MPQIQSQKEGGKIVWSAEDWSEGLAPNWTISQFPIVLGGNKLTAMTAINPFRRLGIALPGYKPSSATNNAVVTEYLRKGLVYSTNVYIVSNGAKIQQFDGISTLTTPAFHTITAHGGHTTPVGNDCAAYAAYVGSSYTQRYFYSWSDNTDWDVGTFDFNATFDDDFMSTAPATPLGSPYLTGGVGYPHPLIVGDDDILYIGDRNFLHALDGSISTNGKFFPAILTLPTGWIITSIEKSDSGLMIFTYYLGPNGQNDNYRGQARAWLWNYGELDITRSYNLNDNITSESFTIGNTIGVFTKGRIVDPQNITKTSKIQLFDGTKFVPVQAFIGDLPIRGGVEIQGDCITFNSGGTIYAYGSKTLGVKSGLNKIATSNNGTSSGMLGTFFDSNNILSVSSGTTTTGGLEMFSTNFEGTISASNCFFLTSLAEPAFPLYEKGRIKTVTIEFSNTVTPANSTELTLILCDRLNNQQTILSQHTQVTTAAEQMIQRTADTSGTPFMSFDGLALLVEFSRQSGTASQSFGVAKITVDYENYRSVTT